MKIKDFKLKNRLQVLLVESRKSPVVSVQMWVRTGSADEKKGEEGISHFIEHLLFKGTRQFKTGEIAALVEGSGGELNAYTSYDQTVFYVTIASQKVDVALEVISEMMGFPSFDPKEIDNERGVVIEEIKRGEDSLGQVAWKELFRTVFKKHTYKTPIIGFEKNIRELSAKKIKSYYKKRYVPENMFLVVTGDFSPAEMTKKVKRYFEEFQPFKMEKRKRQKEPIQTKTRIQLVPTQFKKTQSYLAWPVPAIDHRDVPALDILSMILGTGDSSRLTKRLRLDNLLVQSVGSMAYTPKDKGVFSLSLTGDSSLIPRAIEESLEVILEMMKAPPSQDEMKRALSLFSSEDVYAMETVDGLSRKVGSDLFYMNDPEYFKAYLDKIFTLKPQDISRIARKYLRPETLSLVYLSENLPTGREKDFKRMVKWYEASYREIERQKIESVKFKAKPVRIRKNQPGAVQTIVQKRKSGLTVVKRMQTETPTFSIRVAALGGLRAEDSVDSGAVELMSRVWTSGSKNYDEQQINHIVESNAAGLSAFGGRNTVGISLEGLSPSQKELYPLYFDLLLNPSWNEKVFEREKRVQLEQLKHKHDNPAQVCFQQFHKMIFDGHPYSRDILGTEETLTALKCDKMGFYHQKFIQLKNMVLVAVGDFDEQLLENEIIKIEKQLPQGSGLKMTLNLPEVLTEKKGHTALKKEQTHIVLGYRGLRIDSEERYALDVIQSVLAGQGGRLFIELRDKNSLAYTVSPVRMEGLEEGYFGTYIGCSPDKAEKAITMMREELRKMATELITDEELLRAQNYLIGQHAIGLQKKSAICQSMLLDVVYGLPADLTFNVIEKYKQVTRQDVLSLAKKIFNQPEILSLVGT
jgi:zinc protease